MSNVASRELCEELYKLSKWQGSEGTLYWNIDPELNSTGLVYEDGLTRVSDNNVPAYDTGCLLRKLQVDEPELMYSENNGQWIAQSMAWQLDKAITVTADTPENSLCKLAILLHKQNILTPPAQAEGESDDTRAN